MPVGTIRDKILFGISRKRGSAHRYTIYRWIVGVLFTVLIAWLPLSGTLRFDLWGGRHMVLGREMDTVAAAKAFAFPFLAVNVLIVVISRYFGRYLCGFVCPYGALARLAEWLRFRGKSRRQRWLGNLALIAICLVLGAITFSFWVDWRVFAQGSALAISLSAGVLAALTLGLFLGIRLLGLRFCRDWCPSGVYFGVLGHITYNGIEFAHPETCTDCGACEKACPMDLKPKDMSGGAYRGGLGFYGDNMSNFALCIRCGDCVVACEGVRPDPEIPLPLRMGWLPPEHRESANPEQRREGSAWAQHLARQAAARADQEAGAPGAPDEPSETEEILR